MKIKQRHFIKSSEIKTLKEDMLKQYDENIVEQIFPKKCRIEIISSDVGTFYAINNELKLWKSKEGYIPVLAYLLKNKIDLKTIIVDMGAIRYVTNGAHVMRPGITKIDVGIKKGDIVRIADETHDRALAVGKAMFDAKEMEAKKSGKVVKNLHTIKDQVWNLSKTF